jgi:hypothetical protein
MDQVSIEYTNISHSKTLENFSKFGFLVWKQTIWQPWLRPVHVRPNQQLTNGKVFEATYFLSQNLYKFNLWKSRL